MDSVDYFENCNLVIRKKYEALRAHFVEGLSCKKAAKKFGYTLSSYYSLIRDFNKHLTENPDEDYFFKNKKVNKRDPKNKKEIVADIIQLRKRNYSIDDIKTILDAQNRKVSESYIYDVLKKDGFERLPRRNKTEKSVMRSVNKEAPKSKQSNFEKEE